MTKYISADQVLSFANIFYKKAQSFSYQDDPAVVELDKNIGNSVMDLAAQFLQDKAVSTLDIRINFTPPNRVGFIVDSTGADKNSVDNELASILNKKFALSAGKIIGKYQKQPFEFTYKKDVSI